MRTPIVAGNWKMNGTQASVSRLLAGLVEGMGSMKSIDIRVFSPFIFIPQVQKALQSTIISWGAQDVDWHESGAYTGETSAAMLDDFGCTSVLVGHSERRHIYGEDDERVIAKFLAAKKAGLSPILCIGETQSQREEGVTDTVIRRQLGALLQHGVKVLEGAVVAYEPVWAIGTGLTATPEQAQAAHQTIRAEIAEFDRTIAENTPILYGGSVKPDNAATLFAMPDLDGGLIGGASLKIEDFLAICRAALPNR